MEEQQGLLLIRMELKSILTEKQAVSVSSPSQGSFDDITFVKASSSKFVHVHRKKSCSDHLIIIND